MPLVHTTVSANVCLSSRLAVRRQMHPHDGAQGCDTHLLTKLRLLFPDATQLLAQEPGAYQLLEAIFTDYNHFTGIIGIFLHNALYGSDDLVIVYFGFAANMLYITPTDNSLELLNLVEESFGYLVPTLLEHLQVQTTAHYSEIQIIGRKTL